jgi:hypothetical protein
MMCLLASLTRDREDKSFICLYGMEIFCIICKEGVPTFHQLTILKEESEKGPAM